MRIGSLIVAPIGVIPHAFRSAVAIAVCTLAVVAQIGICLVVANCSVKAVSTRTVCISASHFPFSYPVLL